MAARGQQPGAVVQGRLPQTPRPAFRRLLWAPGGDASALGWAAGAQERCSSHPTERECLKAAGLASCGPGFLGLSCPVGFQEEVGFLQRLRSGAVAGWLAGWRGQGAVPSR